MVMPNCVKGCLAFVAVLLLSMQANAGSRFDWDFDWDFQKYNNRDDNGSHWNDFSKWDDDDDDHEKGEDRDRDWDCDWDWDFDWCNDDDDKGSRWKGGDCDYGDKKRNKKGKSNWYCDDDKDDDDCDDDDKRHCKGKKGKRGHKHKHCVVPTPAAAWPGLALLGGLVMRRRRA